MSALPPETGSATPEFKKARESLSQFIARILDQLSIGAWLPAGIVVFGLLLIGQLEATSGDLRQALTNISQLGWTAVVLLLAACVLATVVTQAFSFGAIRLLEGYWGATGLGQKASNALCAHHVEKRRRIKEAFESIRKAAIQSAAASMAQEEVSPEAIAFIQTQVLARSPRTPLPEVAAEIEDLDWRDYADPALMRRLEAMQVRLAEYPVKDRRILPTKVGNVIRAAEERAHAHSSVPLEVWVLNIFNQLPTALQAQHDEHRTRVDLYAQMVFLSLALGSLGAMTLTRHGLIAAAVAAVASGAAWISYRAFLASGRGYGSALEAIGAWERQWLASGVTAPAVPASDPPPTSSPAWGA